MCTGYDSVKARNQPSTGCCVLGGGGLGGGTLSPEPEDCSVLAAAVQSDTMHKTTDSKNIKVNYNKKFKAKPNVSFMAPFTPKATGMDMSNFKSIFDPL